MEPLKLPTDWPELGNHLGGFLGLAAEPVAEMMCLFSRTEPANHTTQMHLDGWSTEQLCYQLWIQLPVCLPTSWMKVYHYDWYQSGIKGAKIRVKMCVRGRRETKKITVLKKMYISTWNTPRNIFLNWQIRQGSLKNAKNQYIYKSCTNEPNFI